MASLVRTVDQLVKWQHDTVHIIENLIDRIVLLEGQQKNENISAELTSDLFIEGVLWERERVAKESVTVKVKHFATQPHYRHEWPSTWAFPVGETRMIKLSPIKDDE